MDLSATPQKGRYVREVHTRPASFTISVSRRKKPRMATSELQCSYYFLSQHQLVPFGIFPSTLLLRTRLHKITSTTTSEAPWEDGVRFRSIPWQKGRKQAHTSNPKDRPIHSATSASSCTARTCHGLWHSRSLLPTTSVVYRRRGGNTTYACLPPQTRTSFFCLKVRGTACLNQAPIYSFQPRKTIASPYAPLLLRCHGKSTGVGPTPRTGGAPFKRIHC